MIHSFRRSPIDGHLLLNNIKFKLNNITCIIVNYDDCSGKYIYRGLRDFGYIDSEYVLNNLVEE